MQSPPDQSIRKEKRKEGKGNTRKEAKNARTKAFGAKRLIKKEK